MRNVVSMLTHQNYSTSLSVFMIKKIPRYFLPTAVLILGISLSWLIFWETDLVQDQNKSLTLLISSLGIIFGLFQVSLNISTQKIRDKNKLRYEEYRRVNTLLSSISESLNQNMNNEIRVHRLVVSLMNQINKFINFNKTNNEFLFEGIADKQISKNLHSELEEILVRTDELRAKLEKLEKRNDEAVEFEGKVREMNWHNDIRENLKVFNEIKYDYLKELQLYFK